MAAGYDVVVFDNFSNSSLGVLDRMEHIALSDEFLPEYDADCKKDALALIREIKDDCKEISLRTLISVSKVRASNKDWKDLAAYMLTA